MTGRYTRALLIEFRHTILALMAVLSIGTALYAITPHAALGGQRPSLLLSLYGAWIALLSQSLYSPPETWYLMLLCALGPLAGVLLVGEGVVRFALLMISRRQGEKEWMRVMASTYTDHVILCGVGHLGFRVLEHLVASNVPTVVLEKDVNGRFVAAAKAMDVPVLIRDMKEDQALLDAGITSARAVIIATNDDMANIEVAIDSRRFNPRIRVVMRLFDQQIAGKIAGALTIDAAFSASALAAPLVAALSLDTKALSSMVIGGVPHVISELKLAPGSRLANRRIDELESAHAMRILAVTSAAGASQSPPSSTTVARSGDTLIVHCRDAQLTALAAAAKGS